MFRVLLKNSPITVLFALARFFIASHTVALLPPLRVTIAKELTDNGVVRIGSFFIASHTVALLPPLRVTVAKKLTDNGVIPK